MVECGGENRGQCGSHESGLSASTTSRIGKTNRLGDWGEITLVTEDGVYDMVGLTG